MLLCATAEFGALLRAASTSKIFIVFTETPSARIISLIKGSFKTSITVRSLWVISFFLIEQEFDVAGFAISAMSKAGRKKGLWGWLAFPGGLLAQHIFINWPRSRAQVQ